MAWEHFNIVLAQQDNEPSAISAWREAAAWKVPNDEWDASMVQEPT
jgi:hypothetical protein